MKNNNFISLIAIIAILLIIIVPSILKVSDNHKQKLYDSKISQVKEKAILCILEKKCINEKIYLKDLYEYGYIKDKVVNPITKEYFNEDESYLIKKNKNFKVYFN